MSSLARLGPCTYLQPPSCDCQGHYLPELPQLAVLAWLWLLLAAAWQLTKLLLLCLSALAAWRRFT